MRDSLDYVNAFTGASVSPNDIQFPPTTVEKLERFKSLPAGWHYGEGGPIADNVVAKAQALGSYLALVGLTRTDAFAGQGGEVLLAAYQGDHYIGIILEEDGTMALQHDVAGVERVALEGVSEEQVRAALLKVAREIWNSFGYSIQGTSIMSGGGSMNFPSRNLGEAECPLYAVIASTGLDNRYAGTSGSSIHM